MYVPTNLSHKPEYKKRAMGEEVGQVTRDGVKAEHKAFSDDGLMVH